MKSASRFFTQALAVSLLVCAAAANAQRKLKDKDCLACHSNPSATTVIHGKTTSLYVNGNKFRHSIHGAMFSCVDCHKDVTSLPHETLPRRVSCAGCHANAQAAYALGVHARDGKYGRHAAATCQDCHGNAHQILAASDPQSAVFHDNIPATCGKCHGQKFLMESYGLSSEPVISYQQSVHGRAAANGFAKAAVCTDCHGGHKILPPSNPRSPISKVNVAATCGKCHTAIEKTFMQSSHGQALAHGNQLAPTCTDCHGIHSIASPTSPNAPTAGQNLSRDICARCHAGVRLSQEFGVPGNRVASYFQSYHGLAVEGGSLVAANCSSCHGVHNILPSSDPRSTIYPANLATTCGKCHKGATQKFALTAVHLQDGNNSRDAGSIAVRWVRIIYLFLIFGIIGGMFLHNAIIWRSKTVALHRMQNPRMTRMTANQRWQHLVLLVTFIVLVITGFALKFPNSWFAHTFGMGAKLRSFIHRTAGVVLIGMGIYHLCYLAALKEGRRLIRDLTPRPNDAFDAWKTMLYYLGLRSEKPHFGRFSYAEKTEYWALVWGTALMGLTGIMIWAKVWVGDLLARWWVDIATAIHFYEAILATLAIVVWHLYQVFFDPDIYPMNWTWLDGTMSVERYKNEHALDRETLAEASGPPDSAAAEQPGK